MEKTLSLLNVLLLQDRWFIFFTRDHSVEKAYSSEGNRPNFKQISFATTDFFFSYPQDILYSIIYAI